MGKTRTKSRSNSKDVLRSTKTPLVKSSVNSKSQKSTEDLLQEAATHLDHSQPEQALALVQEALKRLESDAAAYRDVDVLLQNAAQEKATFPSALVLGGDISLAMGDVDEARAQYEMAVKIDPNGALVSAEPYLQLAQICEEGGQKSIYYFDKAIEVMRNEIEVLDEQMEMEGTKEIVDGRRARVADALCGMAEVYMTDLSWEPDAEQRCEQLVTEAVALCPDMLSAGVLQTLASVRISQKRVDEAKRALARSVSLWKDVPEGIDDPARPDFATRVALARLLMEVEQEEDALTVVQGLVKEDDQSVEALYLGGWCHVLLSQKADNSAETRSVQSEQARERLGNCLKLYRKIAYEDEPLRQHAEELVQQLNKDLNLDEEADGWETEEEQDDQDDNADIEADDVDHARDQEKDVEMTPDRLQD
ncbi:hypothetical protein LTR05_001105 [Lithohypha guttulata]|uniref:Assembly chaperone of rpl4 n=1 Tax=Lithohypha guttulata TaxID=1690604 RepID=A0AAN7YA30_9EURO|nr:hypothetical protein LTR05_001105 [Lithohypha guttulata]